jgi:subtilisin family serine protease
MTLPRHHLVFILALFAGLVPTLPAAASASPEAADVAALRGELPETRRVVVGLDDGSYVPVPVADEQELEEVLDEVESSPRYVSVEADPTVRAFGDPLASKQWSHERLAVVKAHGIATGKKITVAVLDTGVDASHEDLAGQVLKGFDVLEGTSGARTDPHGHGTQVAGMVAAIAGNGIGIRGAAPHVRILPVRVLDSNGRGTGSDVAAGIDWAVDAGADVINLSLGGGPLGAVQTAVRRALDTGTVVVAAAGNSGDDQVQYPAGYPETVAVAATTAKDERAKFSSYGDHIDVAAPGAKVYTTGYGNQYGHWSGTSASAPLVSAVAALALEAAGPTPRSATHVDAIVEAITTTAVDLGPAGWDPYYGHGRIRADQAVLAASTLSTDDGEDDGTTLASTCKGRAWPLTGDWDVSGKDGIGWWCDGRARLRTGAGVIYEYRYGRSGDVPISADWNGDGRDTLSVIRDGTWYLNNSLTGGAAERSFVYGRVTRGDVPIAGRWDRGTRSLPGIVRDREWHLRAKQSGGASDWQFVFGRLTQGDLPLWGDWTGNGRETAGIVRKGEWHLRNRHAGGSSDISYIYGRVLAGDKPVVGDWTGDDIATPGIVRGDVWHLKHRHSGGSADESITLPAP